MSEEVINKLRKQMIELNLDGFLIDDKANRYYVSGFTGTDGRVLITQNDKYIFADGRYFEQLSKQSPDFEVVDNHMKMAESIATLLEDKRLRKIGIESEKMNVLEYLHLKGKNIETVPTSNFVEKIRMIKNDSEVEKIKKAASITDKTFHHILNYIKSGMSEKQVANEIDRYGLEIGADGTAFETIVASGIRSALPHGHASNKILKKNEMIILDFGFMVERYYSDITRTITMGKVDKSLKKAYQIVLEAQNIAIKSCQVGVDLKDIDLVARKYITSMGFGKNFLHGTGHGLGLTVHEFPLLNIDSVETIQEGMTFTIEPGIYLEGLGGIRIEDDIWINADGQYELLTNSTKEWIEL